jgi:hypothetical protein
VSLSYRKLLMSTTRSRGRMVDLSTSFIVTQSIFSIKKLKKPEVYREMVASVVNPIFVLKPQSDGLFEILICESLVQEAVDEHHQI